jgi:hypothetical protein
MSLRIIPVTVAAGVGNRSDPLQVKGTLLAIREATAPFSIVIDGGFPLGPIERGDKLRMQYNGFQIVNLTAAALTVFVAVGESGDIEDYRVNVKPQIASRASTLWDTTFNATAATANLVSASDTERVELICFATATNAARVILEAEQGTTKRIGKVEPGQTFRVFYTGPVYVWGAVVGDSCTIVATKY